MSPRTRIVSALASPARTSAAAARRSARASTWPRASLAAWTCVWASVHARSITSYACACAFTWRTHPPASAVAAALPASACCTAASHRLQRVLWDVYDMAGQPSGGCCVGSAHAEVAGLYATDLIDAPVQSCASGRTEPFNRDGLIVGARTSAGPRGHAWTSMGGLGKGLPDGTPESGGAGRD
jgi:hypothetical protein